MNIGSRLWISSEEVSMKSDPKPNAQMPVGKVRHAAGFALLDKLRLNLDENSGSTVPGEGQGASHRGSVGRGCGELDDKPIPLHADVARQSVSDVGW